MKTLLFQGSSLIRLDQLDATGRSEADFTTNVIEVITKLCPHLYVIKFNPKVFNLGSTWKPDLALIDKQLGYWYVTEVELMTHDLYKHVVPQVSAENNVFQVPFQVGIKNWRDYFHASVEVTFHPVG